MRATIGVLLLVAAVGVSARYDPYVKEALKTRAAHDDGEHTFYVMIKQLDKEQNLANAEVLAKEYKQRLGEDKDIKVMAASKDKLVVVTKGSGIQNQVADALRAFKETSHVENKPTYALRGRNPRTHAFRRNSPTVVEAASGSHKRKYKLKGLRRRGKGHKKTSSKVKTLVTVVEAKHKLRGHTKLPKIHRGKKHGKKNRNKKEKMALAKVEAAPKPDSAAV